ncbi:MAG: hypothetical protein M1819_005721 [Sarea resinae]|nr:MAG: hypothetical protein M1819_005721 [Sarea resinae]
MVDFRAPAAYQFPQRKPVPMNDGSNAKLQPLTRIQPDSQLPAGPRTLQNPHHHARAPSSSGYSQNPPFPAPVQAAVYQNAMNQHYAARRTPSNATASTSTSGTGGGLVPVRTNSSTSGEIRRSTSSRSAGSPSGYVALMRKQKATVWCDRAQHEDPRILAQQKAAKMRAAMEVIGRGATTGGRTSTSGSGGMMGGGVVRSKIRHHGAQKAVGYTPANLAGGGVPMRLSASEVGDEGNSDGEGSPHSGRFHQRTGSGKSSLGSGRRHTGMSLRPINSAPGARFSQGSSPGETVAELAETPATEAERAGGDYFGEETSRTGLSGSSGSSGAKVQEAKDPEELRRRGSVDDRTMTMSGVRLFVANPDLSD